MIPIAVDAQDAPGAVPRDVQHYLRPGTLQLPALPPLALYVHLPWCLKKCPYCDFNSHELPAPTLTPFAAPQGGASALGRPGGGPQPVPEAMYLDALRADLEAALPLVWGRKVISVFIGGGTPSLFSPEGIDRLIADIRARLPLEAGAEITLEANPSSVEAARFAGFAAAGVNRLSLGLQALDDADLKALGRPHDLAQGLAALDIAQRHFARVSFDLIYDRPGMTTQSWEAELRRALGFGTDHLSLYQLTIEAGTRFAALHGKGLLTLPDSDVSADLFEMTRDMTAAAGIPAYEVSNHARVGSESRHNITYWTYGDYAGIGPGAHGRRMGTATERIKKPEAWLAAVGDKGHGMASEVILSPDERATEALVMGLRLASGIDAGYFGVRTGCLLADVVRPDRVDRLVAQGLLEHDDAGLRLTLAGQPFVDAVLREIAK